METGKPEVQSKTPNKKLPYVKAVRLVSQNGKMIETKEAKAFPRIAWEKMFDKRNGNPILPNMNWRFIESIPAPHPDDILIAERTGGSEMASVIEAKERTTKKAQSVNGKQ